MSLSIYDERRPLIATKAIIAADTTTFVIVVPVSEDARRIDALLITSFSASSHILVLRVFDGATEIPIGTASIPANVGQGGTACLDALAVIIPATIGGLVIPPSMTLKVGVSVTLSGGDAIQATALGGYF